MHSLLSPSGSSRWVNCPASVLFTKDIKEEQSIYAAEGTLAHELAEKILNGKSIGGLDLPENMLDYVLKYVSYVNKTTGKYYGFEQKFEIPEIKGWGTIDCWSVNGNTLHIIDLKYGEGKRVFAKDNMQLLLYAWGAYSILRYIFEIEMIQVHIVQPRMNKNGVFEFDTVNPTELAAFIEYVIKPAVEKSLTLDAEFNTGEWCWFCKGRKTCKMLKINSSIKDFEEYDIYE